MSSVDFSVTRRRPNPTTVFDSFWRFAAERQRIFHARARGEAYATDDAILREYKFTNAYRASDRSSQTLLAQVLYTPCASEFSAHDIVFRTLLYKIFNRPTTWRFLTDRLGQITWATYRYETYEEVLSEISKTSTIYSAAYIMPPPVGFGFNRKHRSHLKLLETMMNEGITRKLQACTNMEQAFQVIISYPSFGDFLAFQFVTDINYSTVTDFSEDEFVMPGPGALDGIAKCFDDLGDLSPSEVIRWVFETQDQQFVSRSIDFQNLWGRSLQLIDCQNIFCEIGKYARVAHPGIRGISGRQRIKQRYKPTQKPLPYVFPPKWNLDVPDNLGGSDCVTPTGNPHEGAPTTS